MYSIFEMAGDYINLIVELFGYMIRLCVIGIKLISSIPNTPLLMLAETKVPNDVNYVHNAICLTRRSQSCKLFLFLEMFGGNTTLSHTEHTGKYDTHQHKYETVYYLERSRV